VGTYQQTEKKHGRKETQTTRIAPAGASLGLPNAGIVVQTRRRRETIRKGKVIGSEEETSYVVTSVPAEILSAETAAGLDRGHWSIENRLHHVKDAGKLEDRYSVNNGLARILAALRSPAVLVVGSQNTTAVVAMRRLAGDLHKAVLFITCNSLDKFALCFLK